jgi:DNA-binding MarR family transcriptional regulator
MANRRSEALLNRRVDQVRRFERAYESCLRKEQKAVATASEDFSVADVRVIAELGFAAGGASEAWLAWRLDLDTGYLCRIVKKLRAYGLVESRASSKDGRMRDWELTKDGCDFAARIEDGHRARVRSALDLLPTRDQRRIVRAIGVIERLLMQDAIRHRLGLAAP